MVSWAEATRGKASASGTRTARASRFIGPPGWGASKERLRDGAVRALHAPGVQSRVAPVRRSRTPHSFRAPGAVAPRGLVLAPASNDVPCPAVGRDGQRCGPLSRRVRISVHRERRPRGRSPRAGDRVGGRPPRHLDHRRRRDRGHRARLLGRPPRLRPAGHAPAGASRRAASGWVVHPRPLRSARDLRRHPVAVLPVQGARLRGALSARQVPRGDRRRAPAPLPAARVARLRRPPPRVAARPGVRAAAHPPDPNSEDASMATARREMTFLLAEPERRLLRLIAARIPPALRPNHLTALGVLAATGVGIAYALTNHGSAWLFVASALLVVQWFGDSLDGTLARVRHTERPRYGYYLDHIVDAYSVTVIGLGLGLSPYVDLGVALGAVVLYHILAINVYLESMVFGAFKLAYGRIGPRSEEHTSELQSQFHLVCRLLL